MKGALAQVAALAAHAGASYARPWFYAAILAVFALERLLPAVEQQPLVSRGLCADFLWFNADAVFRLAALPVYFAALKVLYDGSLSFLTIRSAEAWPAVVRFPALLLLQDLLYWLHHVVRHKVTAFWRFHAVHHAQTQMNLFTDLRIHFVEYLIGYAIIFIPMFMFRLDLAQSVGLTLAISWYTHVYHANLRTHYGPLKHFLVTPQSHRIHHSIEARHRDKNFGVLFTFWDRLFGTLHDDYDEYPATGIDDPSFPLEQTALGAGALAAALLRQLTYPFSRLYADRQRRDFVE